MQLPRIAIALWAASIVIAGLGPRWAHAQPAEGLVVLEQWEAAIRAHDIDAALDLFADNAVVMVGMGLPTAEQLIGPDQIRPWIESVASAPAGSGADDQNRLVNVTGNVVTWTTHISRPDFQRLGVDSVEVWTTVIVEGGAIRFFGGGPTSESRAQILAALATQGR